MKNRNLILLLAITGIILLILVNVVFKNYFMGKQNDLADKIIVANGYSCNIILKGLVNPTAMAVNNDGDIYVAENNDGKGRVIEFSKDGLWTTIINQTSNIITDIAIFKGGLYISEKGSILTYRDGELKCLISGLPSLGDYSNNGIMLGKDGLMYICQGASTNSGIVGIDNYHNGWLNQNPYFHDYPPSDLILAGKNFKARNPFRTSKNYSITGAFLPFNTESIKGEQIKGRVPGNASIFRCSYSGQIEDTFAYGIRNPISIVTSNDGKYYISTQGMENRGSRPIANGKDYIYEVKKGDWLGWPDYEGGEPITMKKFKAFGYKTNTFILEMHPILKLIKPLASFVESGRIGIIDIGTFKKNTTKDTIMIPLQAGTKEPAKIVTYNTKSKSVSDFIINKDNSKYLQKPTQCLFTKNNNLYILEASKGVIMKIKVK